MHNFTNIELQDLGLYRDADGRLYSNVVDLQKDFPQEQLPNYSNWDCIAWVNFHKKLKSKYGRKGANDVWSEFFNNKPIGWTRDSICTSQPSFISYFKDNGITFDDNFYTVIDSIPSFGTLTKTMKTVLIVGGVLAGVGILFILGRGFYKAAQLSGSATKGMRKLQENPELILKAAFL